MDASELRLLLERARDESTVYINDREVSHLTITLDTDGEGHVELHTNEPARTESTPGTTESKSRWDAFTHDELIVLFSNLNHDDPHGTIGATLVEEVANAHLARCKNPAPTENPRTRFNTFSDQEIIALRGAFNGIPLRAGMGYLRRAINDEIRDRDLDGF